MNFYGRFFTFIQGVARRIYPKFTVQLPNSQESPVVYISHHQNLFGPFHCMLWFPQPIHAWILYCFLDQKACYKQFIEFTFTKRYKFPLVLAKIICFPFSYFVSKLLTSGKGIPVYRGSRKIMTTIKMSIEALRRGENIIIFPDIDYQDHSSKMKDFYNGFLYLEKYYYQATGKHLCFIPLFVSRNHRTLSTSEPIYFRDGEDFYMERKIVQQKIQTVLNDLAIKYGDS